MNQITLGICHQYLGTFVRNHPPYPAIQGDSSPSAPARSEARFSAKHPWSPKGSWCSQGRQQHRHRTNESAKVLLGSATNSGFEAGNGVLSQEHDIDSEVNLQTAGVSAHSHLVQERLVRQFVTNRTNSCALLPKQHRQRILAKHGDSLREAVYIRSSRLDKQQDCKPDGSR